MRTVSIYAFSHGPRVGFIRDLAEFERESRAVEVDAVTLRRQMSQSAPLFEVVIAKIDGNHSAWQCYLPTARRGKSIRNVPRRAVRVCRVSGQAPGRRFSLSWLRLPFVEAVAGSTGRCATGTKAKSGSTSRWVQPFNATGCRFV
jgi:hypothetical protein